MQTRLSALGMQSVELPEGSLRGHTFHYAKADITTSPLALTVNPDKGPSREGVYRRQRMTASFMHLYFPSDPAAAMRLFLP
jgi:cobyrinic acid a,c-diamide synthase